MDAMDKLREITDVLRQAYVTGRGIDTDTARELWHKAGAVEQAVEQALSEAAGKAGAE